MNHDSIYVDKLEYKGFEMKDIFMNRRDFLKKSSLGLASLGLAWSGLNMFSDDSIYAALTGDVAVKKGNMYYRKLGKTGLKLSEISFNGGVLNDVSVLSYAMDLGLNYIDTAPIYLDGKSEERVGKILKYRPNELIVGTKWEVREEFRVKELVKSVEASLKRLGTDTIDIIQVWAARRKTQVLHEPVFEAFEKLKKAGKVRFLGLTSHKNEEEVCREAVNCGQYDVLLASYNYENYDKIDPIIKDAVKKGIGVIAQFSLLGGDKIPGNTKNAKMGSVEWVLKNQNISSTVVTMGSLSVVDEYMQIPASIRK